MNNIENTFISLLSKITHLGDDRYVKEFVRVPLDFEQGRTDLTTDQEREAFKVFQECASLFTQAAAGRYPVLKELDEVVFVNVLDLNNLHLQAIIHDGQAITSVGWDTSKRPTLIVPLYSANLRHLRDILSDQEVNKEELYRIARVLFVSFMRGLYDADYAYTPGDKRYLKLDNILHVEMLPMNGIQVEGFPGNARATVVNVNRQWLVFEGWQGTPRTLVTCDLDQALQYYYLCNVQMRKAKDIQSVKHAFDSYMELRAQTCKDVYRGVH
jgi:hypothetical protein